MFRNKLYNKYRSVVAISLLFLISFASGVYEALLLIPMVMQIFIWDIILREDQKKMKTFLGVYLTCLILQIGILFFFSEINIFAFLVLAGLYMIVFLPILFEKSVEK